jgi:hypothetical protein
MSTFMDLDNLSQHEKELLDKAVPFARGIAEATGSLPSSDAVRDHLKCAAHNARRILHAIRDNKLVPFLKDARPNETLREENVMEKDKWNITLPKTRIHTLNDLLEYFEVDLEIWEVKRFVVNKWEMGYIKESTKTTEKFPAQTAKADGSPEVPAMNAKDIATAHYEAGHEPLYQVKAELVKKVKESVEHYAKENARLRSQLEKSNRLVASERKTVKYLAANHAGYDDILSDVKEFVSILGDFQLPIELTRPAVPQLMPAVGSGHTEDAVFMLSDMHFGDVIRREDTSGFPEFDLVISANRFGYVIQKAKQVLSLHRAMYPIKKLYVWIGGDVGNGILHDAPNSNALFTPAQVHFSYHMLKFAIEELLTLTQPDPKTGVRVIEEIVLLFTVGNHMRMDEKMPHKYQAQRTLDWLIYQFLIERYRTTPGVTIREEMSPFIFENIRGHRHMFAHGMQVGFRNSPDAQNKAIGQFLMLATRLFDSPEWRKKNGLQGETFSRACIGDIHIPISYPRFKSNGSLNGQNELGVNWTLEPIPAGQQIWGVADKHQETWQYFLECTHIQREREDFNNYGIFAAEYAKRIGRC